MQRREEELNRKYEELHKRRPNDTEFLGQDKGYYNYDNWAEIEYNFCEEEEIEAEVYED